MGGGDDEGPAWVPGLFVVQVVVGRCLSGIGVVDSITILRRVFTDSQQRWIVGDAAERLPKQGVGHYGHGLPTAQTFSVKRADHVVGEFGRV